MTTAFPPKSIAPAQHDLSPSAQAAQPWSALPVSALIFRRATWIDASNHPQFNLRVIDVSGFAIGPQDDLAAWARGLDLDPDSPFKIENVQAGSQSGFFPLASLGSDMELSKLCITQASWKNPTKCHSLEHLASSEINSLLDQAALDPWHDFQRAIQSSGFQWDATTSIIAEIGSLRPASLAWPDQLPPNYSIFASHAASREPAYFEAIRAQALAFLDQMAISANTPAAQNSRRPSL